MATDQLKSSTLRTGIAPCRRGHSPSPPTLSSGGFGRIRTITSRTGQGSWVRTGGDPSSTGRPTG